MERYVATKGKLPETIEKLDASRKMEFVEFLVHVAMVQLLLKNGGKFEIENASSMTQEELDKYVKIRVALKGGDGKIVLSLDYGS